MAKKPAKQPAKSSPATAPVAPATHTPTPAPSHKSRPSSLLDTRVIYCGDNLEQLGKLPDKCVDLVYIDPPFNSNRNYEVFWGESKEKRSFDDRHESTQAYIDYMRPRCQQLARVLKPTGSFYYHCDWHASHYVKVMLDQLFSENNFLNEIVWKRASTVKGNFGQGSRMWSPNTDSILFYSNGGENTFRQEFAEYSDEYIKQFYKYTEPDGRRYRLISMIGPGGGAKGNPHYDFMGVTKYWRYSQETMQKLVAEGMIVQTKPGTVPQRKLYLDKGKGVAIQTLWDDIEALSPSAAERLGYPTQKPLALLQRIINASSNPNDIVLDAFCGCGTALVAAQNLGRQWVGVDISPTACRVMAKRLKDVCKMRESEPGHRAHDTNSFIVRDLPWTIAKLEAIPPFEFENWAVIALGGVPNKVQVGDMGIDGRIFPVGTKPSDQNSMFAGDWFPVQVKQRDKVGRPDIDAFEAVMHREDRQRGFFVAFNFSSDAEAECEAFRKKTGRIMKLITVQDILDEQLAKKM
ncbi:MAG: DNA methyltransferase [Gemmatimonadaceae bacterium]|nr:DNA methyltransferase [Gemmatimonadaceae bacterium]